VSILCGKAPKKGSYLKNYVSSNGILNIDSRKGGKKSEALLFIRKGRRIKLSEKLLLERFGFKRAVRNVRGMAHHGMKEELREGKVRSDKVE